MFGLLIVDKPAGVTSRDMVNAVQRLARPDKVGHAGTLDPLATGVLLVCVGPAVRLVDALHELPKRYSAEFLLGRTSESADVDEPVTERPELPIPTRAALDAALPALVGRIWQTPPAFSAIKQGGVRAYERARRGEVVELAPRPIDVYELHVRSYEYPRLELDVVCGSGCYVRSLGRDLARAAGSDAVMSRLVRTAIGPFRVEEACVPSELDRDALAARLRPPLEALVGWPRRECDDADRLRLVRGQSLAAGDVDESIPRAAAVSPAGELLALLRRGEHGEWRPDKVFVAPPSP